MVTQQSIVAQIVEYSQFSMVNYNLQLFPHLVVKVKPDANSSCIMIVEKVVYEKMSKSKEVLKVGW